MTPSPPPRCPPEPGQANEASLQRCEAAAGDLPCLKLLLPLDVVLFKPRDPLTVVLRDPVPADPDAPVSASRPAGKAPGVQSAVTIF